MSSMDFNIGMEDVNLAVLQELLNRVAFRSIELVSETRDAVLEKKSFQEFSRSINDLHALLQALDVRKIGAAIGSEFTKGRLEVLDGQLRKAGEIIKDYKSGSRLRLLLHSHSLLWRMQDLAREIAATISSFQLVNLDMALHLKTKTTQIIKGLESMEFQSAAATETIAGEIENSISQNSRNREHSVKLLEKIAEAVGASSHVSLIQSELALLKQEKEDMDAAKKQAEALQLTQLMQLLLSTGMVTRPQNEEIAATYHPQYPIESLICPLCNEVMSDPVAISCGHSFERKAIQEYLKRGEKNCPTCGDKLSSFALTPNISLRSSIQEWKQREMDLTFQAAISDINSDDPTGQNRALEHLQSLIHMPKYAEKAAEEGLIKKLVEFLKDNRLNIKATLKCLHCLAKYSDDHKQAMAEARAVRHVVKQLYKGETESDALAILLELSKMETIGEKIGNTKDCIPVLVSLLGNDKPSVSEKAHNVLENLSSNTHFAVKMAEAGYFPPFVARFNQGGQETRALMSAALTNMELKESNIKDLKDKQFIHNMIQMLSSNDPGCKSTCLKCIKKLIAYPKIVMRLLSDTVTIPLLLGLISFGTSESSHYKQEAAEILALMVEACQYSQFQSYQGLQELQSEHNINLFLQLVASSEPEMKIQFLHLLVELSYKCEKARSLIQSNNEAITHLFASLESDQQAVRRWALKLIHCTSDGYPDGVPLPPSPHKEAAVNTLATILTCSQDSDERSIAAAIISKLPKEDNVVDEVLRKSEALKAIHEVICCTDEEFIGIKAPASQSTTLLENALAALLRFTEPTKPQLQRQLGKLELYPSLVRLLSTGSSTAKQRTAIALAQLSQSSSLSVSNANTTSKQTNSMPMLHMMKLLPNMSWCCSASAENLGCSVHGSACSARETFCLVKSDAVRPLVQTLSDKESGVAEAALMALETLLMDHSTLSHAIAVIVDSQGVIAILQVLEKGSLSAKSKALDLLQKILNHTQIGDPLSVRSETILIQLLDEDALRKKVALVLRQMGTIPEQSSYF